MIKKLTLLFIVAVLLFLLSLFPLYYFISSTDDVRADDNETTLTNRFGTNGENSTTSIRDSPSIINNTSFNQVDSVSKKNMSSVDFVDGTSRDGINQDRLLDTHTESIESMNNYSIYAKRQVSNKSLSFLVRVNDKQAVQRYDGTIQKFFISTTVDSTSYKNYKSGKIYTKNRSSDELIVSNSSINRYGINISRNVPIPEKGINTSLKGFVSLQGEDYIVYNLTENRSIGYINKAVGKMFIHERGYIKSVSLTTEINLFGMTEIEKVNWYLRKNDSSVTKPSWVQK